MGTYIYVAGGGLLILALVLIIAGRPGGASIRAGDISGSNVIVGQVSGSVQQGNPQPASAPAPKPSGDRVGWTIAIIGVGVTVIGVVIAALQLAYG